MREIKMKSLSAGPGGVHHPGTIRILPKHEAAMLVNGGHAEYTIIRGDEIAVTMPEELSIVIPDEIEVVEPEEITAKKKGRPKK